MSADKPYGLQECIISGPTKVYWRLIVSIKSRKDADDAARIRSYEGKPTRVVLLPAGGLVLAEYSEGRDTTKSA